jgi:type II secretory pathway pseudopilin PulG
VTELAVVLVIIAVIAILAWPALTSALAKRDLTRTMNNGRELYLAAFRMAADGAAKSDTSLAWPGDYPANTLADYCSKLLQNDYLKESELQRILSAPGVTCTVNTGSGTHGTVTLAGKSALKIYKAKGADPSNTIFSASSNYLYDTALNPNAVPFGDKGFVIVRKGGDAGVYRPRQATVAGFENNAAKFQSDQGIGALPGAANGNVIPGDGATVLPGP